MKTKPEYYYCQSSVIPYKLSKGTLEILMITSRKKKRWIFPKGIIDEGLMPNESAAKEALEEAGILGEISSELIGKYKYKKWGGKCKVRVYGMKVTTILSRWVEEDFRERKWMNINEAVDLVKEKKLKKILQKFVSEIENLY